MREQQDIVVIGGGQAGLAMSGVLQQQGRDHVVLERGRVGERWRTERWDSLRFQFPNWTLQLPGYTYRGPDPEGFAHYLRILGLLEDYAGHLAAPVREHNKVRLSQRSTGTRAPSCPWLTGPSGHGTSSSRRGLFQLPRIPALAPEVPRGSCSSTPRAVGVPRRGVPEGAVFVVGSGPSGTQIADELLSAGRRVYLSVSRQRRVPPRLRRARRTPTGGSSALGRFAQTIDSFPARQYPPSTVVDEGDRQLENDVRKLAAAGAKMMRRVTGEHQTASWGASQRESDPR